MIHSTFKKIRFDLWGANLAAKVFKQNKVLKNLNSFGE